MKARQPEVRRRVNLKCDSQHSASLKKVVIPSAARNLSFPPPAAIGSKTRLSEERHPVRCQIPRPANFLELYCPPGRYMRPRQKREQDTPPDFSAAPYVAQRAYERTWNLVMIFRTLFQATKGVFWPGPNDPKTWYGRLFRLIGLLCVYAVIAAIVTVAIQEIISSRR